ncbi:MAG: hypothetical protein DRN49_04825 [Thaumarchaeota archaeon]|nr:MAG: hypothetical protein DRN49_04825 [Nitrososphaerota archaeon]
MTQSYRILRPPEARGDLGLITIIGHLTIDEIVCDEKISENMGGVACYASLAARMMGSNVKIISVIGEDFPEKYLKILSDIGIDVSEVVRFTGAKTTRFRIRNIGDRREMWMKAHAPKIKIENVVGDIIYLGPVAQELRIEDIKRLVSRHERVCLDPQGILRELDESNRVKLVRVDLKISGLWMLKISIEEGRVITDATKPKHIIDRLHELARIILLTMGKQGAIVSDGSKRFFIPIYKTTTVDPTGAGDVFGGAFIAEFQKTGEIDWASAVGAAAASVVVEDDGFLPLLSKDFKSEVYRRAELIYKRVEEF